MKPLLDTKGWEQGLEMLRGPLRVSLARSMGVAGGKVLRDEAKARAPVETGRLKSSIYLAYKDKRSTDFSVTYSVSWNAKTSPHGHLLEFGHWRVNVLVRGDDGLWRATKERLDTPVWVAARPFLRPAFDSALPAAKAAMMQRGRERLVELLNDASTVDPELAVAMTE